MKRPTRTPHHSLMPSLPLYLPPSSLIHPAVKPSTIPHSTGISSSSLFLSLSASRNSPHGYILSLDARSAAAARCGVLAEEEEDEVKVSHRESSPPRPETNSTQLNSTQPSPGERLKERDGKRPRG